MNTASTFYITAENYEENGDAVENAIRNLTDRYSDLSLWTLREQKIEDSAAIAQQKRRYMESLCSSSCSVYLT